MSIAVFKKFPEVFTGDNAPAACGTRDPELKTGTPAYRFGWIVSRPELYQAIYGKPAVWDFQLSEVDVSAENRLYDRWKAKGYDDNEFNPKFPTVSQIGRNYVVVYLTCNDTDAIVKCVMEKKEVYDECRACVGRPKMMEMEPAWIRWGINYVPKELAVSNVDQ